MPPAYVKPYVKQQKNDRADADAICEAVTRPTMRFVETKKCEQQSVLMLHRVGLLQVRLKIMLPNAIRAHLTAPPEISPTDGEHVGPSSAFYLLAVTTSAV